MIRYIAEMLFICIIKTSSQEDKRQSRLVIFSTPTVDI